MEPRVRILLLESNRYRWLLLQRALTARLPNAILVRFTEFEPAQEELQRGRYEAALVSSDHLTTAEARRLSTLLQDKPHTALLVTTSPETSKRIHLALSERACVEFSAIDDDAEVVARQIAAVIAERRRRSSRSSAEPVADRVRLSLSGE